MTSGITHLSTCNSTLSHISLQLYVCMLYMTIYVFDSIIPYVNTLSVALDNIRWLLRKKIIKIVILIVELYNFMLIK